MIGALSLAFPLTLITLPLGIAGLIYVYRERGSGIQRVISSSLFLKLLEQKRKKRTKFKPPLRFLFELLLFALFAVGAAKLFLDSQQNHISVVLDNSLSMSVLDTGIAPARTRLERAKEQAADFIKNKGLLTEVSIWVTSPTLRQLHSSPVSPSSAQGIIAKIEQGIGADNLEQSLKIISSANRAGEIAVFTDRRLDAVSQNSMVTLHTLSDEKVAQNVALLDIQRVPSSTTGKIDLIATIGAFTRDKSAVDVIVWQLDILAGKAEERKLRQVRTELPYGQKREVKFENLQANQSYKISIVPEENIYDAVPHDNSAWISSSQQSDLVAYSGVSSLESLKLHRTGSLKVVPLDEIGENTPTFSIFYGVEAPVGFRGDALVIMPPGRALVDAGAISSFDETHPLVSYISFGSLELAGVRPLEVPVWATKVVQTTSGTILYAGVHEGKKQVVFGFDPLPFDGKKAPVRSIFVLNAFKWLSDKNVSKSYAEPGVRIQDQGETLFFENGEPLPQDGEFYVGSRPGIVRKGQQIIEAINFFDAQESNPSPPTLVLSHSQKRGDTGLTLSADGVSLTHWMVILSLLLLAFDYVWFEVRARRV